MICISQVSKSFDGFMALDSVSLNVKQGSVYGLIGPNGAGKTTLLKILAGVYKKDGGEVYIDGEKNYENLNVKKNLVFISDEVFYYTSYTILDTAKMYADIYKSFSWERFEKLKDIFKIDVKRKVKRLSKGMQKQVAFWIAVSCCPKIMLLDEPVDGLDPVMRRNVWKIILQDVAESGLTVLVSSHNLRELEDVCDHVGIMHNGKVVYEKALNDLKGNTHKLQIAFKGDMPPELSDELAPIHKEEYGSVKILIVRGNTDEIMEKVNKYNPLIADIIPLTLEEVFIYELGGLGYEFENIIL